MKNDIVYCFLSPRKKHGRVVLRLTTRHSSFILLLYRLALLTILLSSLHTIHHLPLCLCAHPPSFFHHVFFVEFFFVGSPPVLVTLFASDDCVSKAVCKICLVAFIFGECVAVKTCLVVVTCLLKG